MNTQLSWWNKSYREVQFSQNRSVSAGTDLSAVFVVVHAGQGAVRIAVDVRVLPTGVPVPGPTHVTLETAQQRHHTDPQQPAEPSEHQPHPAGHLPVPLHGALGVGVTGVKGQGGAGQPREAACRLVPKETGFTASTPVGALGEERQWWLLPHVQQRALSAYRLQVSFTALGSPTTGGNP